MTIFHGVGATPKAGTLPPVVFDTQIDRLIAGANYLSPSPYHANPSYHNIDVEKIYDIRLRLLWPAESIVTVPITKSGDAVDGFDYTLDEDVVSFQPGELEKTAQVTLLHNSQHITAERRVVFTLGTPTGPAISGQEHQDWTMALRWTGNASRLAKWDAGQNDLTWSKNSGTKFFTAAESNVPRTDGLLYIRKTGGTAIEGIHFNWFANPIQLTGVAFNQTGGNGAVFIGVTPIPGNITQDVTLEFDFHFVYHPPALTSFGLTRKNMVNWTEKFDREFIVPRDGRRPELTPDYPTGYAFGGDHAPNATPSLESKRVPLVLSPLGDSSWFVFSARESVSPGKQGQGTLLRSFISGTSGDLSGSDAGYPGLMVPLQCRSMYWRQTEEVSERSGFFTQAIYDRTMPGGGELHSVNLEWPDTDIHTAPILTSVTHLNTFLSGWRLVIDDPLCEPVVANGWHRVDVVYESVPEHSSTSRFTVWSPSTAYSLGDWVIPTGTPDTDFSHQCTVAGTSGVSEPIWNNTDDATIGDGSATWTTHIVDGDHVTNRGSCSVTTNDGGTPDDQRGKGQFLWGDQIELGVLQSTSYQRVPLQYYWFECATHPDNVPITNFTIQNS